MNLHTIRLKPGADLRKEIIALAKDKSITAGFVITCVGALSKVVLRMAGATPDKQDVRTLEGSFEIVSLVGTLSSEDCHLHIAVADKEGKTIGGHLKEGSIVDVTAEIVVGSDENTKYLRELDQATGFEELVITPATD